MTISEPARLPVEPGTDADAVFNRPPRILRFLPTEEVEIPAPPAAPAFSLPPRLGFILIPAITGVFYLIALVARGGQGGNIWLSLPIVAISFVSVGFGIWNFFTQRRSYEQAQLAHANAYAETLGKVRSHLRRLNARQRTIREENDPDLTVLFAIVHGSGKEKLPESRLWERRPTDDDFLQLRIGRGDLPTSVAIKPPQANQFQYSPALHQAVELAQEFALVRDVPIKLSLRAWGSIGIAGREALVIEATYALLWQSVVHHAPQDVRIAAFWPARFDTFWAWLRWLPHTRAFDDDSYRLLARYDGDPEHRTMVIERLHRELRWRAEHGSAGRPHVVVILDSYSAYGVSYDAFEDMITRGRNLGFSVICLTSEAREVPSNCGGYLELESTARMALSGAGGGYQAFAPETISRATSDELARRLASVTQIDLEAQHDLPRNVRFSTLLELGELTAYNPANLWIDPEDPADSWHPVPVGITGPHLLQNRWFLNLNEGFHGVHGIVAGTTGSGKSEFLLTFLMALTVKHSPDRLNLMLIDFKGGATFQDVEPLPHTVGMVTDLEGYQAERALIAINSELDRRKKCLKHANVSNIREYRRSLHKNNDPANLPIPNLLIVIDEFDEMVRDYPDFVQELIRVAKQGRSLGVHLLFATQQPSQVKEGLLRNLTYWIALRVTAPEDSKTMITIPDAAYLTTETPGRGYFRVNKQIIAFQSARVTIPYQPFDQGMPLGEIDATGRRRILSSYEIGLEKFTHDVDQICEMYHYHPRNLPTMVLQVEQRYSDAIVNRELVAGDTNQPIIDRDLIQTKLGQYLDLYQRALQDVDDDTSAQRDELIRQLVIQLQGPRKVETELAMITHAMESAIGKRYAAERYHVWTTPLAPQIPLADLVDHEPEHNKWMTAPIGMLDLPTLATQQPLMLNLTGTHGHLLLLGASRSGKTTLLRTLMLALAIHHSPADLWIYTIDPSGRGCGMVLPATTDANADADDGVLPHVADTLMPQDTARIERLLVELNAAISERRELLRKYGADTLAQYRQQYRTKPTMDAPPPDILVVIDGLAELVGAQSEATIDALKTLIREASPFGIACVVTASLARDVSGWLGLFETRIALRLTDENDSDLLIGKKFAARIRAEQPGRAFLRTSDGPVELQIALPVLRKSRQAATHNTADADEVLYSDLPDELKYALRVMSRRYRAVQVGRPNPLRLLPGRVDLSDLLVETSAPAIPFARDSLTLRPVNLRLDDGTPHLLIAGGPDSGKSEALRTLLSALTLRYSPDEAQLVLVDYRTTTLLPFADLPHTRPWDVEVPIDSIPSPNGFATAKKEVSTLQIASNEAELAGLLIALRTKLMERTRTKQNRPRLILVMNDLDLMIGKEQDYLTLLAAFAMRGSEIGLHIVLTATDFAAWNSSQLVKAIRTERCSLYLGKPPEMGSDVLNVGNTGIKWSKVLAKADFPPGRGLALLRGQQMLVQVAFAAPSLRTIQNETLVPPSADQTMLLLQESVSEDVLVPQEYEQ